MQVERPCTPHGELAAELMESTFGDGGRESGYCIICDRHGSHSNDCIIFRASQALASKSEIEPKVTKLAQVGNTVFHPGVSLRLLIERAEREYAYQQEPEQKAERELRQEAFLEKLHAEIHRGSGS